MLIEFRVANHRSLRDEQVFTMEADTARADRSDERPRSVLGLSLLPAAALYGANASGKSNVLSAMSFMREAVLASHRAWPPDDGVPREPFAWGVKRGEPSTFEITVFADGVKYQYGFVASDERFMEEWLYAWPGSKKQTWFVRDENHFKFGENLKGENELIEEVTRGNALFLSTAVQHKHIQLEPLYTWFRTLRPLNIQGGRGGMRWPDYQGEHTLAALLSAEKGGQPTLFGEDPDSLLGRFRTLLRTADIGIEDLRATKSEEERYSRRFSFQVKHKSDIEDAWLPLEEESRGTRTLIRIALPILQTMRFGGTVLMDELESSLHPSLAQAIVGQFNSTKTNQSNAQLIFTTHDTNLLGTISGEPTLRRDQVWLTEKDDRGATILYPATDYKPRKNENLERGYIQGRYGAIPFLGNFNLLGN